MRSISLLLLIFSLQGCSSIAKKMYGIKNPEIETKESIISYANSIHLDTSAVVTVDTSLYGAIFKRIGSSVPEAEIFSANGDNLSYKMESQDCNAGLFAFIPGLKRDTVYSKKDDFKLEEQLKKIRDLNGNSFNLSNPDKADYYLFIYWVKWAGKLNKDHVNEWEDLAHANKNVKIKVYEVNLDLQSWWPEHFRQRVINSMSKK
jgi:hypothetical protein